METRARGNGVWYGRVEERHRYTIGKRNYVKNTDSNEYAAQQNMAAVTTIAPGRLKKPRDFGICGCLCSVY